jgi:hypothetical protein
MTGRLFATLAMAAIPVPGLAEDLPEFEPQHNTWNATHIVVVEDGKVVESWKGDLKTGATLPEGAARFTRIRVPGPDPWQKSSGDKPPTVTGKRMVLFLAHVPQQGGDPKTPVWMGAYAPGHPSIEVTAADVAWVEGDRVYTAYQPINPGGYALTESGGIAGLRQRVDVGLALRAQFEAAKADKDPAKRAERLAVLTPFVSNYAGYYGVSDCFEALGTCGRTAVPLLTKWATEHKGKFRGEAFNALTRLGDDGFDAVTKILDAEARYWKAALGSLRPGKTVRDLPPESFDQSRPNQLYHALSAAARMKLSAENQERLQKHPGLRELDDLLGTKPWARPEKSDMATAYEALRVIVTGKFRKE